MILNSDFELISNAQWFRSKLEQCFSAQSGFEAGSKGHFERPVAPEAGSKGHFERPVAPEAGTKGHFEHPVAPEAGSSGHFERPVAPKQARPAISSAKWLPCGKQQCFRAPLSSVAPLTASSMPNPA